MVRVCTVCSHLERREIDGLLVSRGTPYRHIAARFDVSTGALQRHRSACLPALLVRAYEAEQTAAADDLLTELRTCLAEVKLLRAACDRWLRDPDNPEQYDIGPRAEDVSIIYETPSPNGRGVVRKKERLSAILRRVEGHGYDVEFVEAKHADPRELLLKALARMDSHLTLVAKLAGELDERAQVNIVVSAEWVEIRSRLLRALDPHPAARQAVVLALGDGS